MPPLFAAVPTVSGELGLGSNGLCDPPPPPPAPPRRPRSRIGLARAAGEERCTRGVRGCATPLGVKEEKSCCASTAPAAGGAGGGGPALVPPVDDAERGDACRVVGATATGASAAGVAGQSTTATGVASCPGGAEVGDDVMAGWASSEHVQFQTQF